MITNVNKNFGILKNNNLEYAPNSFNIPQGVIVNPPKDFYLAKGYYEILNEKPEPDPNCFVKFDKYEKDDEAKTITFIYVQQMIPIIREVNTYSKLRLEMALFQIGKTQEFDDFIDQTMLSNDFGQEISLRKFYNQAQDLKSDNEYFETYKKIGQDRLDLDDEQVEQILEECKI